MSTVQPNSENLTESQAYSRTGIPPGVQRSQEAFRRHLPELLQNKRLYRQWVAYHGDELVGIGRSETDLYEECFRRGLKDEDLAVCLIVPELPRDIDMTPMSEA